MACRPTAPVVLCEATEADRDVVANLVPYYIYDFSEYTGWPCGPDGRFEGCRLMDTYWSEAGKYAFMLRAGDELVGFAMVRRHGDQDSTAYSIAEFFVLRKFRGRGVGQRIAGELFDRFRGDWKVEQLIANRPAIEFWRKAIERYPGRRSVLTESRQPSPNGEMNVITFNNRTH